MKKKYKTLNQKNYNKIYKIKIKFIIIKVFNKYKIKIEKIKINKKYFQTKLKINFKAKLK